MSIARLMQMGAAGAGVPSGPVWTDPDLANASYDSVSFSVAGQQGSPRSVFFSSDGSKVYITGNTPASVSEYNLSTSWDISTASYVQDFSVSTQDTVPTGVSFKTDGTKMYVTGGSGDDVNEYSLSTAWDISTASYVQNSSVAAQDTTPYNAVFKTDGTSMYIVGYVGNDINEYSLSTAWDISTASYVQNFSFASQSSGFTSVAFASDGSQMFALSNTSDTVFEYSLSTAWDISTASYSSVSFSVTSQENSPSALAFKSDGSKMYVIGFTGDTIYQYSTA